jgi:hypothetical protein
MPVHSKREKRKEGKYRRKDFLVFTNIYGLNFSKLNILRENKKSLETESERPYLYNIIFNFLFMH